MSRTEPLNDVDERTVAEAEADLQRLLSIGPSPEFAAKVRARVAEERTKGTSRWGLIGLLATMAAAVIVVLILRGGVQTGNEEPALSTSPHNDIVLKAPTRDAPDPIASVAPVRRNKTVELGRAPEPAQRAEIIIDPAIGDAIRRLAIAARNTTLDSSDGENLAAPNSASDTLPVAEQLNIPELALAPADPNGGQ